MFGPFEEDTSILGAISFVKVALIEIQSHWFQVTNDVF